MSKIRVLQIITRLVPRGAPRHVLDIAAGLDPDRYEVEVLAGRGEPGEGSLWENARSRGVRTRYVDALQRAVNPARDAAAFTAIYRHIRQSRYDIVHTHISKSGLLGRVAARCVGTPAVLHTYHGEVEELRENSLRSRVFLGCERLAAGLSDGLVCVSEHIAGRLLARGIGNPQQYSVIHNGIEPDRFRPGAVAPAPLNGGPIIGTAASLTPEKGLDVLLNALPALRVPHPELRLYIVGGGPLRETLEALARSLGLAQAVEFTGAVHDVRPYLAAFDLFVQPSRNEGMGVALLEAMASECPVIASRTGGIPEIVKDGQTGRLVPPGDPDALAAAVLSLLRDPDAGRVLGRAGRACVTEHFNIRRMIRRLDHLYIHLLEHKRGRNA